MFGKFKDRLIVFLYGLLEELSKNVVAEDSERAIGRNFANGGWMKAVRMITIPRLYENGFVRQAMSVNFPIHIANMNT